MDTGSSVYEIEPEDFYKELAKEVETKFDTSRYSKDDNKPLPIRKNKVICMKKEELDGKTIRVDLRAKMYGKRKMGKNLEDKHCKVQKCVELLKALLLMTTRDACLTVKQYTDIQKANVA